MIRDNVRVWLATAPLDMRRGFDRLANYNKLIEEGLSKTQALYAAAYSIPITGAVLKTGDAYTGQKTDEEQAAQDRANREKALQVGRDIRAEAGKLMAITSQRHGTKYDIAGLNPKFSDEYAKQHVVATEAVKADLAMRKELSAVIDAQAVTAEASL